MISITLPRRFVEIIIIKEDSRRDILAHSKNAIYRAATFKNNSQFRGFIFGERRREGPFPNAAGCHFRHRLREFRQNINTFCFPLETLRERRRSHGCVIQHRSKIEETRLKSDTGNPFPLSLAYLRKPYGIDCT